MNYDQKDDISNLQRVYVNKYLTTKHVNDVINMIECDYIQWLSDNEYTEHIINAQIDMIIFLMTKEQFQRILRSTLILMNLANDKKQTIINMLYDKQCHSKFDILKKIQNVIPAFLSYFVICMYSYI